jgi:hypothetical protein
MLEGRVKMDKLVKRLARGRHPVVVGGPTPSREAFTRRVDEIGYVFLRFTDTSGGTEIGIRVDHSATARSRSGAARSDAETLHVEGTLELNYVPVRCIADIDVSSLTGWGHLAITKPLAL